MLAYVIFLLLGFATFLFLFWLSASVERW